MSWFNPMSGGGGFVGSAAGYIPFAGADGSLTDDAGLSYDAAADQLLLTGVLSMQEQAAAGASVAGRGRLWVKNTAPCTLFFTDDTGADIDLTAGSPNNSLDNAYDQGGPGVGRAITVDSGPVTLNASVQNALGIALATTLNIRALTITEDDVVRSAAVVYVKRETSSTGHIFDLDNWGEGSALSVNQFGSGDAIGIRLASDLDNTLAQALVVTESNFNYTQPQVSLTRSALATGVMISLTPGAATSAAIATTAGNLSLSAFTTITQINGSLMAAELAAAPADVAGYGQYWVKNDAPCTPWFTGDTGTDYQLAALNVAQAWTAAQRDTPLVVDFTGATTTIDADARNQFYGQLSIATTELQIPTNIAAGQWFTIDVQQAAAGGDALTFVASYDWGDAGAPDFTALAASEYATIVCHVLPDGATISSSCSLNNSLIGTGTDNHIPRYDGTAKLQNSGWVIADTTNVLSLVGMEMALNPESGYGLTITQTLASSGTPAAILTITGGAHTTLATTVEAVDVLFDLGRTVQWAAGALASQRAIYIEAPTYAFDGASTVTNAATVYIGGAPVPGTNATLTSTQALWIDLANTSNLDNHGLVFTDAANAVRTGSFLKATACALATGPMIDLIPGAATTASIRTWGGKIDLSVAGDGAEFIHSDVDGYLRATYGMGFYLYQGAQQRLGFYSSTATFAANVSLKDGYQVQLGTGTDTSLGYQAEQSPDALVLGLSVDSNLMIICRKADVAFDFAHGTPSTAQVNPTFFFHDSSQSTTNWTSISHGVIATGAGDLSLTPVTGSGVVITQAVSTSGTPGEALTITGGVHTGLTTQGEATDVLFDIGRTVTWTDRGPATQRFVWIEQPTMSVTGLPSELPTVDAATLYIAGAPITGAGAVITSSWALWIDAGAVRFDGTLFMAEAAAAAADIAAFGQFWVKDDTPNIPKFTDDAGTDFSLQRYTRMAHKMVGPAPSSAVASSVMSMTGASEAPSASLSMIHCVAAGSVIGLAATLSAARDADVTVTVEISTDDGDSFAAMGTPCAITVATAARGNEATFVKGTHTFAAGNVLRIIATYSGSSTVAEMSANIDVEYAS